MKNGECKMQDVGCRMAYERNKENSEEQSSNKNVNTFKRRVHVIHINQSQYKGVP
jgi:hypothetical protein